MHIFSWFILYFFLPIFSFGIEVYYGEGTKMGWNTAQSICASKEPNQLIFMKDIDHVKSTLSDCNLRNRTWVGNIQLLTPFINFEGCFSRVQIERNISMQNGNSVSKCYISCNETFPIAIQDFTCSCLKTIDYSSRSHKCAICLRTNEEICGKDDAVAVYGQGVIQSPPNVITSCVQSGYTNGRSIKTDPINCSSDQPSICEYIQLKDTTVKVVKNGSWIANTLECWKSLLHINNVAPSWKQCQGSYIINARRYSHVIPSSKQSGRDCEILQTKNVDCLCGFIEPTSENILYTKYCDVLSHNIRNYLCSEKVLPQTNSNGIRYIKCNTSSVASQKSSLSSTLWVSQTATETAVNPFQSTESNIPLTTISILTTKYENSISTWKVLGVSQTFDVTQTMKPRKVSPLRGETTQHSAQEGYKDHSSTMLITAPRQTSTASTKRSTDPATQNAADRNSNTTGTIIGAVIGCLLLLVLVAAIAIYSWRRKSKTGGEENYLNDINGTENVNQKQTRGNEAKYLPSEAKSEINQPVVYAVVMKPKKSQESQITSVDHGIEIKTERDDSDEVYIEREDTKYDHLGSKRERKFLVSDMDDYSRVNGNQVGESLYSFAKPIDTEDRGDNYSRIHSQQRTNVFDKGHDYTEDMYNQISSL